MFLLSEPAGSSGGNWVEGPATYRSHIPDEEERKWRPECEVLPPKQSDGCGVADEMPPNTAMSFVACVPASRG
jgi:hypothetical protein